MGKTVCRATRYDRLGAEIALADTERKAKRNSQQAQLRSEARIYRCQCGGWHLTWDPDRARDEVAA